MLPRGAHGGRGQRLRLLAGRDEPTLPRRARASRANAPRPARSRCAAGASATPPCSPPRGRTKDRAAEEPAAPARVCPHRRGVLAQATLLGSAHQKTRRSGYSRARPSSMPSSPSSRTARSIAMHHSAHASPATGSPWVSAETATAWSTMARSSPRWASATGAVRIRLPLPAAPRGWASKRRAAAAASAPAFPSAAPSTLLVWTPTSLGPEAIHARNRSRSGQGRSSRSR